MQYNLPLVNLTVSVTAPQFSKEIYVFFLCVKSILTALFGWLHHYIRLTTSIAAIGYTRNVIFKIYQKQAVTPLAYSQNLTNQQEAAVQRLKPRLTCDMRDQCLFFTQVNKEGEQEGIKSASTWLHYSPPLHTLWDQPSNIKNGISLPLFFSFLIIYLVTYFFQAVSQPASAPRTKLFLVRFPFKCASSFDCGTSPGRQLLWYQAKASAPQNTSSSTSTGRE